MRLKIVIVIVILTITLNHCSKDHEILKSSSQEIAIDEGKTAGVNFTLIKKTEVPLLYAPRLSVAPQQDKCVYYGIDKGEEMGGKTKLVAISLRKDLTAIGKKIFDRGQGPGDVGTYNRISLSKNKIYISENSNLRVSIYDHNWNFLKSVKHNHNYMDVFFLFEDATVFITKRFDRKTVDKSKNLFDISYYFEIGSFPSFKLKKIFQTKFFPAKRMVGGRAKRILGWHTQYSWFCRNGEIFLLLCGKYRILKFNLMGDVLRDISIKFNEEKTDLSREKELLLEHGFKINNFFCLSETVDPTAMIIPLEKGFVVVRRKNQYYVDCNNSNEGDYFSYQLEYLGKVQIPCFYSLLLLSGVRNNAILSYDNGFMYLLKEIEDNMYIEKWEVKE